MTQTRVWIEATITAFLWFIFGYILMSVFANDLPAGLGREGLAVYNISLLPAFGMVKQMAAIGGVIYFWSLCSLWASDYVKSNGSVKPSGDSKTASIQPENSKKFYGLNSRELQELQKMKKLSLHFDKNLGLARVAYYHIA